MEKNGGVGHVERNGKEEGEASPEGGKGKSENEYLNYGEEDQMEIEGYRKSWRKTGMTWACIVCTFGILRLVFHWWPRLMLYATHVKCSIRHADKILALENYQQKHKRYYIKPVYDISAEKIRARTQVSQPSETGGNISLESMGEGKKYALQSADTPYLAIPDSKGGIQETGKVRAFNCKKLRYLWNDGQEKFVKLQGLDECATSLLHSNEGLSVFQQRQRQLIYGSNEIIVEVQTIIKLLFLEVLNPFYIFQIFSVTLWFSDNYVYYASAIVVMSAFGIVTTIIQTRSNQKKLKTTVQSSDVVTISRGSGLLESVPTESLVPGDLIIIPPHGITMSCDAALLSGNCIVNESMLTGESVPVTKIPLPNRSDILYNSKEHARHTLFCGTQIMQTRFYSNQKVTAVVLRTGFLTAKGNLVRSILYPPPVDYKFEKDSYKFVAMLGCIAAIGFINSVLLKISHGERLRNIIVDSLDLITIVVPPALPAAMTVGRMYAQRRLKEQGIYCISPRAINVSGSVDCVCFDKTGTLTEDGMDMWGVVPVEFDGDNTESCATRSYFQDAVRQISQLQQTQGNISIAMAACHSLTRIDGNLIGDPLDLKVFEWTEWSLEEPNVAENEKFDMVAPTIVRPNVASQKQISEETASPELISSNFEVGIVRQFPFSSSLQRMSVITRTLGAEEFELFCKGSPEMISALSLPNTVPENFATTLERYTHQGYRVIALGHRKLPSMNYARIQRVIREDVERDLTFLGLVVMENRLKEETSGVMRLLKNAAIRTVMVTGDNLMTAICVARECDMLEKNDKIIVIDAKSNGEDTKVPKLVFNYVNNRMDSKPNGRVNGSFVGSALEAQSDVKDVESPSNRYRFALTGNVFSVIRTYYPELLSKVIVRGTIFARMSPDQKQQLIEDLQGLGYFVGMCGDGANDCGALKAAHAGIALSEAEASVASPFTSKTANITCIPYLIKEGRSALVTSFGIFKYMAVYSLTQFITVLILYTISANLSDLQFLYIDLLLISVFAFFFGRTEPYGGPLVKKPPPVSLVSVAPIVSIVIHILTNLGMQIFAFTYVQQQSWFKPFKHDPANEDTFNGAENYSLFTVSAFQYIISAVVFSRGKPYRKSLVTNPGLLASLVVMTALTVFLVLFPFDWSEKNLQIQIPEQKFYGLSLVGFAVINFVFSFLVEQFVINFLLEEKLATFSFRKRGAKHGKEFERIDYELQQRLDWPNVNTNLGRNIMAEIA